MGIAAGLGSSIATTEVVLVGVLCCLALIVVLVPGPHRVERTVLALVMTLVLAGTHIEILAGALRSFRWIGYAIVLATGWRFAVSGESGPPWAVLIVWAAFMAVAGVSGFYSIQPGLTVARWGALLLMTVIVFRIVYPALETVPRCERMVSGVLWMVAGISATGWLYALVGGDKYLFGDRFQGILSNPNATGLLAGLVAPLAIWWFSFKDPRSGILILTVVWLTLIATEARGPIVGAVAGSVFVLWSYFRWNVAEWSRGRRMWFFIATLLVLVGLGAYVFRMRPETFWMFGGRLEHWSAAISLIRENPWFGYGYGIEDQVFAWAGIRIVGAQGAYIHNTYLGLMVQLGLIGAAMFVVPWFTFLAYEGRWHLSPVSRDSSLRAALFGCMLTAFLTMFFETWVFSPGNSFALMFWILFAVLLRLTRANQAQKEVPLASGVS
jgi:O-antigen ligase